MEDPTVDPDPITLITRFPNQTVAWRCSALPDSTLHGTCIYYYPTGKVHTTVTYRRGIRHGRSVTYFLNGTEESVFIYKNGVPHGPYRWYYPAKQLKQEGVYQAGKLVGWVRSYFRTGELKSRFFYREDKKSGQGFQYHKNGVLRAFFAYNTEGIQALRVAYDSTGNYLSHVGSVIADLEHDPVKLLWDDLISLNIGLAVPPGWEGALEIIRTSERGTSLEKRGIDDTIPTLRYSTHHRSEPEVRIILRARLSHEQYPGILLRGDQRLTIRGGEEVVYE